MARVKAKVKVFVDNILRNEGDVFEYDGPENENLDEVDKDGNVVEKPEKDKPKEGTAAPAKAPEKPNDTSKQQQHK